MSKRLEDGVNLGPGLLKKQHWNVFGGQLCIIGKTFGHEAVCSKHCSLKKRVSGSYLKSQWNMPWDRKGINNEIMQFKTFNGAGIENLLIIKF